MESSEKQLRHQRRYLGTAIAKGRCDQDRKSQIQNKRHKFTNLQEGRAKVEANDEDLPAEGQERNPSSLAGVA